MLLFYHPCMIQVMKEVEQAGDKIILFIDELHVMVGAGGSDGAIDASNILKPSLARGKLRCLGATTTDEYAKHIEKDPALARRFQSVYIPEPSAQHTVEILQGLREKYETHHRVLIPDDAIRSAVQLTGRYLTSKKFPDKAIDLLDECMSRIRNRRERKPPSLVEAERHLSTLVHGSGGSADTSSGSISGGNSGDEGAPGRSASWNPVVEDCIRFCNNVVNGGTASGGGSNGGNVSSGAVATLSTEEQARRLASYCDTQAASWVARNQAVEALFEARTALNETLEKQRLQRKNGVVDSDGFLSRRVEQKEAEIAQLCAQLMSIAEVNTGRSATSAAMLPPSGASEAGKSV